MTQVLLSYLLKEIHEKKTPLFAYLSLKICYGKNSFRLYYCRTFKCLRKALMNMFIKSACNTKHTVTSTHQDL